ncbi:MAG: DEAD/DEAH box helicase [Saprospiraceae bacterium]|nr:DEAD/DEAH box helicase [Saprospiraceae bacterium]
MKKTIIAYSLDFLESISIFLPSAYFVEEEEDGKLGYMIGRAVPENIDSYGFALSETPHESLLAICHQLTVGALEERYNNRRRKPISLSQLIEDPSAGNLIRQFVQRKMETFLERLMQHQLPVCLAIQRKVYLEDIRVYYRQQILKPHLWFQKRSEGIDYRLSLFLDDQLLTPHDHDIHILSDQPAYLVIDYQLFQLEAINGNKIKPFLKKKEIHIPSRMTKTYLQKFVMDVVNKVDIEADGFDVQQIDQIKSVQTSFTEDFIDDRFVLDLVFDYNETFFFGSDPTARRNRLLMDDSGNVTIRQIIRSQNEISFISALENMGLHRNEARRFTLPGSKEKYALIQWVIDNQDLFLQNKITLHPPNINGMPVALKKAELFLNTIADNDWFDIKGSIQVGDVTFYFSDLIESIRNEDPLLILPNGKIFIIPDSWMTKYSSLAIFGKRSGEGVRINKSQYTLIEEDEDLQQGMRKVVVKETEVSYEEDSNLNADLRPYQLEGVKWLLGHQANGLGACLADDMGLGKTLQTLAVLSNTKNNLQRGIETNEDDSQLTLFQQNRLEELNPLRALIILPASLVFNWVEEIRKFCPHFLVCSFVGPERKLKTNHLDEFDVVLTTYQTALRDIRDLQKIEWEYVILDESHMIKNKDSKIFQAVNTLRTINKISLSGTPIENSLADLWSQMQFINPDILGTFTFFKEHFLTPIQRYQDEAALDQLRSLVHPFILRRRKDEVAKDLPEITEYVEFIPMSKTQAELFEQEKSAARNQLLAMSEDTPDYRMHVFRSLLRLRQICNHPVLLDNAYTGDSGKFDQVIDHLYSILKSGNKVLVFSSFTSHLDLFASHLKNDNILFCHLTGQTSQKNRKQQVDLFQNNPDYSIFLISIKAGGTGLNLTEADYVFILDPWWNPFVEKQAIARAHRIGRDQPITVIRYIAQDSIEEKIIKLQARKRVLAAELIEDQEQISIAKEDLRELLQ